MLKIQQTYDIIPPPIESGSTYYFITESGMHYEVRFGRKANNILSTSIVFGVINEEFNGEEYSMTNKFEVYKVMATIVKIVQRYIALHPKINCYEFTGEPTEKVMDKEGRIRLSLYNRYLKSVFDDDNWLILKGKNKTIIKKK